MQTLILTLHIIVCFLLVILILLQSGKEGMGVIFGGGNSSVFGSAGAGGILAKLTTLMAVIFVITSLSYTYVTSSKPASDSAVLNVQIEEPEQKAAPAEQPGGEAASPAAPARNTGGQSSAPAEQQGGEAPAAAGPDQAAGSSSAAPAGQQAGEAASPAGSDKASGESSARPAE